MKVNGSRPEAQVGRVVSPEIHTGGAAHKRGHAVTGVATERVDVSSLGKKLAAARAPETPDEARIAELKEKLASGKLDIDFEKIADAMLREER